MAKYGTPNVIKYDFAGYRIYVRGLPKIGKTSLFEGILNYLYKSPTSGLLLAMGREDGFKALDGVPVERVTVWEVDESEYTEFDEELGQQFRYVEDENDNKFKEYMPSGFINVVNDLVRNRQDYKDIKLIGIDVCDELVRIAEPVVIASWNKGRSVDKRAKTINEAYGGFGKGQEAVRDLIDEQLYRLVEAGYGLYQTSHSKTKTIKDNDTENEFEIVVGSLETRYDGIFAKKADILATLSYDRSIRVKGKDFNGKDTMKTVIDTSSPRFINFRDDGFNIDCGARFPDIVSKVEFTVENFVDSIIDAIKKKGGKTDTQIKKEVKKEEIERMEKALEFAKVDKVTSNEKSKEELAVEIRDLFNDDSITKEIKKQCAEHITKKFGKKVDELNVTQLASAIKILKGE